MNFKKLNFLIMTTALSACQAGGIGNTVKSVAGGLTTNSAFASISVQISALESVVAVAQSNTSISALVNPNENDVKIAGDVSIRTKVINYGTIETSKTSSGDISNIFVVGTLINFANIKIEKTLITIDNDGKMITNDFSEFEINSNGRMTNIGSVTVSGGVIRLLNSSSEINNGNSFENFGTVEVLEGIFKNS